MMESQQSRETSKRLIDVLRPTWQPNDIIKMFHEERAKIEQRGRECKSLLSETDMVLTEAQTLRDLYSFISPKTLQLHSECKTLIQERNDLRESYDKINYTLNRQEELRSILKRMPEIKNQVFAILNSVSQSFQNKNSTNSEMTPLEDYYGRFFVECRRMKDLTLQLESCLTCANTEELTIYLEEIYRLYIDIREQLIGPVFTKNLDRLIEKANRNYCDLIQQSCASLARTMRNEIQLFQQVFPTKSDKPQSNINNTQGDPVHGSSSSVAPISTSLLVTESESNQSKETNIIKRQAFRELLELLCKIFYEHLRPIIIHVNHLETLAELYKLINETIRFEFNDESFQSTMDILIEDIQERLIFRTEVFIEENILDYKPSHGDLAYPEKFDLVPSGDLYDFQSMWYPTVQRAVLAMHYLKRVFDDSTFSDLAQELVAACYKSLDVAQHLVDERHGGSKIEASLFLSKHIAIIMNQMRIFGLDQSMLAPPSPLMASMSPDDNPPQSSVHNAAAAAASTKQHQRAQDAPKERARD
uniref:Conserved oligomeric Golgi complex subunit 3 n=1 Tax=Aceria tosichella TaxID=561515 RepID=A0A6G1SFS3_9ACAR